MEFIFHVFYTVTVRDNGILNNLSDCDGLLCAKKLSDLNLLSSCNCFYFCLQERFECAVFWLGLAFFMAKRMQT